MKTKKSFLLPTLIAVLHLVPVGQGTAQTFTSLGDIRGPYDNPAFLGNTVYASLHGLVSSGSVFYGADAGSDEGRDSGHVFVVNTDWTGRRGLHIFSDIIGPGYGPRRNTDGARPTAGVILSGGTLYGTTNLGGSGGIGTIFKLSTDGTGFTVLLHGGSQAGLILADNTLYGTTIYGGSSNSGTVFSLNTNGTGYTNLHSFAATSQPGQFNSTNSNSGGAGPAAEVILSGNTLYGTAEYGGAGGAGTVFSVNRDGTGFRVLHNFPALSDRYFGTNSDGAYPRAGLVLSGNTVYGTAVRGGLSGNGTVFAVNTNGTGFTNLYSFTKTSPVVVGPLNDTVSINRDGANPAATLALSGGTLYGTTYQGGSSGQGTVFSLSIATPPTIHDLGHLGGLHSTGYAINARGQVTGSSNINEGTGEVHAFLYTGTPGVDGQMIDLGPGGSSEGYAINASGQVAGWNGLAFLYTGTPGSGGKLADLGTLPDGLASYGHGINDSGQVVGTSWDSEYREGHAFLYTGTPGTGGLMRALGGLGGVGSAAYAINAGGGITGWAQTGSGLAHTFVYTGTPGVDGKMIDLGALPGGSSSSGAAINASGQIAGSGDIGDDRSRAFLYTGTPGVDGQMIDLGILPGLFPVGGRAHPIFSASYPMLHSYGLAINDRGQVAGYCAPGGLELDKQLYRRAFLYTGTPGVDGQMIDLDAWLDANNPAEGAKWWLKQAHAVSNTGLITGDGNYDDGPGGLPDGDRAFLLDASALVIPKPTAAAFRITDLVLSGGNLTLSFTTVTGSSYTLWRSDNLAGGTWTNSGLPALVGTGTIRTFSVLMPAAGVPERFFRIQAAPQQ